MEYPPVSVVMPVRNEERHLAEAVRHVLGQDYPGEFELAVKEQQRTTGDGVVVLTIASTMSSTYEAAVVGARAAGGPVLPSIEEVLADPHRVEPEVLDRPRHGEEFRPTDVAFDFGELDADLERAAGSSGGRHR
jgi:cellulose synthase/poly-beta-1,6-N-acetylglucosamine synthase-like glycosyltransferase